jgi:membrane-bound lytic murein transglycosylase B
MIAALFLLASAGQLAATQVPVTQVPVTQVATKVVAAPATPAPAAPVVAAPVSVSKPAQSARGEMAIVEKHPGMGAMAKLAGNGDLNMEAQYLALLQQANYQQSIIDAISKPAEKKAWKNYRPIFMTEERTRAGVKFWHDNQAALTAAENKYQVPARYIVAIIGVETFYGRNAGSYRVIDALTTLGLYYKPRQEFFANELRQFLQFPTVPQIALDEEKVRGSYAGAMGIGQFMPTSYVRFAADGDGDGKIDLFANNTDAIFSVASYFKQHGWEWNAPVAVRVTISTDAKPISDMGVETKTTVGALRALGYAPRGKVDVKRPASLIILEGENGPEHIATFGNFYTITRYNRSPMYAMAVHQLSQALAREFAQTPQMP